MAAHYQLLVEIVEWVDDYQPGIVRCSLVDAFGKRHEFVEKAPVVSVEHLRRTDRYPRPGGIRCTITDRYPRPGGIRCTIIDKQLDQRGTGLIRVSTESPDGVESVENLSEFVVLTAQVALDEPS